MNYTLEALIQGNVRVPDYFNRAQAIWDDILARAGSSDVATLASSLSQSEFEQQCGGQFLGQEIMALTGLGRFYRTGDGYGDRVAQARKVFAALQTAHLSGTARQTAKDLAASTDLLSEQ